MIDISKAGTFPLGDRVVKRLGYGGHAARWPRGVRAAQGPRRQEPIDLVKGNMTALFDAAMVGVGGVVVWATWRRW